MTAETTSEVWVLKKQPSLDEVAAVATSRGLTLVRRGEDEVILRAEDGVEIVGGTHPRSGLRFLAVPTAPRRWHPTVLTLLGEVAHNPMTLLGRAEAPLLRDDDKCATARALAVAFPIEDARVLSAFRVLYRHGSPAVRRVVVDALDRVGSPSASELVAELERSPPADERNPFEEEARALGFVELPPASLAIVEGNFELDDFDFEARSVWQGPKHVVVLGVHESREHMAAVAPGTSPERARWRRVRLLYDAEAIRHLRSR